MSILSNFETHHRVQGAAKKVLAELARCITSVDSERTIAERAAELLARAGIVDTWYYDCPALVLLGSRSCLSVSGRDYQPADEPAGDFNLITVDLSPSIQGAWGDCSRSFFMEDGVCSTTPRFPEFCDGARMQRSLHERLRDVATPETTLGEVFQWADELIRGQGFENVDFLSNVGHSIEAHLQDRRYLQAQNPDRLSEVGLFTFEPHIRKPNGVWGFKHENIYYFAADGRLNEL